MHSNAEKNQGGNFEDVLIGYVTDIQQGNYILTSDDGEKHLIDKHFFVKNITAI